MPCVMQSMPDPCMSVSVCWTFSWSHLFEKICYEDETPNYISKNECWVKVNESHINRPYAQLLPGLETGLPVTVGQSPAYDFSVSDEQKAIFLVSVLDCSECDSYTGDWPTVIGCPVSNPGNNCANGLFLIVEDFLVVLIMRLLDNNTAKTNLKESTQHNRHKEWC